MVIKTAINVKRPGLPGKRPFGTIYEVIKYGFKSFGYYEDYKQYDPGYYIKRFQKKYSYKPRKRVAGHLGKILWSKPQNASTYSKFGKTYSRLYRSPDNYNRCISSSKGGHCSQ